LSAVFARQGRDALATWRHVILQTTAFDYPHRPFHDFKPGEIRTYSGRNPASGYLKTDGPHRDRFRAPGPNVFSDAKIQVMRDAEVGSRS